MTTRLTAQDAQLSLRGHAAAKGAEIHAKYGPDLGWHQLQRLLTDRACVRYPCELVFDAGPLHPGECAFASPRGAVPEAGFILYVHPYFRAQPGRVPWLVLYQLVLVNYGEFAGPEDAEAFGAAALGIGEDEYYRDLCALADELQAELPAQVGA